MVTTQTTNELLTPKEAAKLLRLSKYSIYRWIKSGWLAHIRLPNGTIRISKDVVDKILTGR